MRASAGKPRVLIVVQNTSLPNDRRVWLEATTLVAAQFEVVGDLPEARGVETLPGAHRRRHRAPVPAAVQRQRARSASSPSRPGASSLGALVLKIGLVGRRLRHPPHLQPTRGVLAPGVRRPLCGKQVVFDHHDLSPEMYRAKFGDGGGAVLHGTATYSNGSRSGVGRRGARHERELPGGGHQARRRGAGGRVRGAVGAAGRAAARTSRRPRLPTRKRHLIGYVGEICEQDGVDHLMRALKILREEHGRDDIHCVVIGTGPHQPAVQRVRRRRSASPTSARSPGGSASRTGAACCHRSMSASSRTRSASGPTSPR